MTTAKLDRRERYTTQEETLRVFADGIKSTLWTALPAVVNTVDLTAMTITATPTIKSAFQKPDGTWQSVTLPVLLDVPIVYPGGGGFTLTFPIAPGDECLIIFASRCIDSWWAQSGIQAPAEYRTHDLSDGFAIVGPRSKPRALSAVSNNQVQLRSNDGARSIAITATEIHIKGNVTVEGSITASGDVIGQGTSLHTHVHSGVQPGSGNTGAPA